MKHLLTLLLSSFFLCLLSFTVEAQVFKKKRKITVDEYVETYKSIAISEMRRSKIPASITLAQGILESEFGNSFLARKGRNHFGIKCHRSWRGARIYSDDDYKRECFRKYKSHYASYIDHSNFLLKNGRYDKLFNLPLHDYSNWAKGLKKAGYASNPKYAGELISLIKRYDLYKFDSDTLSLQTNCKQQILASPIKYNGIKTVLFDCAVTPEVVERAYEVRLLSLLKYNNVNFNDTIPANTMVYLQAPKTKGPSGIKEHVVHKNETIESVAKLYGIKIKSLYKRNRLKRGQVPKEGETLALRGRKKTKPAVDKNRNFKYENKAMRVNYIVRKGDTLYTLARRFGTSVKEIKATNNLTDDLIVVNKKLVIYVK